MRRQLLETAGLWGKRIICEASLGCRTQPLEKHIQCHVDGTLNLLKHYGMMDGEPVRPRSQRYLGMEWWGSRQARPAYSKPSPTKVASWPWGRQKAGSPTWTAQPWPRSPAPSRASFTPCTPSGSYTPGTGSTPCYSSGSQRAGSCAAPCVWQRSRRHTREDECP